MANVTITACANSTPPANTVVATCALSDSSNAQLMMLSDVSRNIYGVTGSPMVVSGSAVVTNQVSASISNTLTVGNTLSASVSAIGGQVSASISNMAGSAAGSPLFVSQTNNTGSAAGSPTFVSVTNAASVVVSSGSVVVTNGLSASISNTVTTTGSTVVTNQVSASISNAVTVAQGASGASPWGVRVLDAAGNAYGVAAGSPLYITGGAAGGTSANDSSTFAAGTTSLTPVGGFFSTNPVALTACQVGAVRMTAQRGLHATLRDDSGNILGIAGSPLVITGGAAGGTSATDQAAYAVGTTSFTPAGGFYSTNPAALTACQSGAFLMTAYRAEHVNLRDSSGNELGLTGSPLVTSIAAASVTVINQVSASISNVASVVVSSGSVVVTNALSASISNTVNTAVLNLAGSAAGSPLFVLQTNNTGSAAGSPTFVSVTNIASVVVSSGSNVITNALSASISNFPTLADKATFAEGTTVGTPMMALMLNTTACLTASQVGVPRMSEWRAQYATLRTASGNELGAGAGSPLFVSMTNMVGSAAGSPQFVTQTNMAGSAAGSPLFVSVTNMVGSAAGSPQFVSVTNKVSASISNVASVIVSSGSVVVTNALSASLSGGSVALLAGANVIGSASAIQGTRQGVANAWPVYLATSSGSELGSSNSPLAVAYDFEDLYFAGSFLSLSTINLSASTSGCIRIVASAAGKAIIVVAATFTTSSSQNIGWVASGAGAASALVQSPMPFGTNGGMDANRMPGALWKFPSGSNAVMTTTSACIVAGNLLYTMATS